MEVLELINFGSQKLKNNNICSYRIDSEILLAKTLNKKREELLINLNQKITPKMYPKEKLPSLKKILKITQT